MIKQALDRFRVETGYNLQKYFEDFVLFCNAHYPLIVAHYVGNEDLGVGDSFGRLDELLRQTKEIEPLFYLKSNSLQGIEFWGILDLFSDCQTKLWSIDRSSRWLRSSKIGRYSTNITLKRALKTRENFEQVSASLGSNNPDDDWVRISRDNQVEEEGYSSNADGAMFKINIRQEGIYDLPNIVSNLDTKEILGKDIDVQFKFEDNDLVTVEYEDAVKQALNTMLGSIKGSIPEFPDYGTSNESIGSSVMAIQYPSMFKHIINMFQRDARWVQVNLIDIYRREDNIFMKISAKTVTNNYLVTNIQI